MIGILLLVRCNEIIVIYDDDHWHCTLVEYISFGFVRFFSFQLSCIGHYLFMRTFWPHFLLRHLLYILFNPPGPPWPLN